VAEKKAITPNMRVWEVYKKFPEAGDILFKYGICQCDSLSTVEKEAKLRKIDLEELIDELNRIIVKRK